MKVAHGATLLAAMPVYGAESDVLPRYFVIVAKVRGEDTPVPGRSEWVCACSETLDSESWYWGHYFGTPGSAIADMLVRTNVTDLTAKAIIREADSNVISR